MKNISSLIFITKNTLCCSVNKNNPNKYKDLYFKYIFYVIKCIERERERERERESKQDMEEEQEDGSAVSSLIVSQWVVKFKGLINIQNRIISQKSMLRLTDLGYPLKNAIDQKNKNNNNKCRLRSNPVKT